MKQTNNNNNKNTINKLQSIWENIAAPFRRKNHEKILRECTSLSELTWWQITAVCIVMLIEFVTVDFHMFMLINGAILKFLEMVPLRDTYSKGRYVCSIVGNVFITLGAASLFLSTFAAIRRERMNQSNLTTAGESNLVPDDRDEDESKKKKAVNNNKKK
jgi:hypothetical protein